MPIITRKPCQGIFIGHEIEVHVFRVRNGQVRFGLTAPRDVLILRSELLQGPSERGSRGARHPERRLLAGSPLTR